MKHLLKSILLLAALLITLTAQAKIAQPKARIYGPTKESDTIWSIADSNKPKEVTVYQMMAAIYQANDHAFVNGDIHKLKSHQKLLIPSAKIAAKMDPIQSKAAYEKQNEIKPEVAVEAIPFIPPLEIKGMVKIQEALKEATKKTPVQAAAKDEPKKVSAVTNQVTNHVAKPVTPPVAAPFAETPAKSSSKIADEEAQSEPKIQDLDSLLEKTIEIGRKQKNSPPSKSTRDLKNPEASALQQHLLKSQQALLDLQKQDGDLSDQLGDLTTEMTLLLAALEQSEMGLKR